MKIVLLQTVRGLGNKWDIKNVPDGYARNRLIPQKIAAPATQEMLARVNQEKAKVQQDREQTQEEMKRLASEASGIELHIKAKADETGKLFGSINAEEIAKLLLKEKNIHIPANAIRLERPIKEAGDHSVALDLQGKKASLHVVIEKE